MTSSENNGRGKFLVRFDWAIKRLLRNKANYAVLEGFLSVLLKEDIKIISILDPEGNSEQGQTKFNRVDLFVEDSNREILIIEVQNSNEVDYFFRMLFAVSKAITDHIYTGDEYRNVKKVFHINIVYFELGHGQDYVYHGKTEFKGIHEHDLLTLDAKQQKLFGKKNISELYPEYYILRVEDFNGKAKDSLDQWIYFLKNSIIPEDFDAKGLPEARNILRFDSLPENEKRLYSRHIDQERYERNAVQDSHEKGWDEGKKEGMEIGMEKGKYEQKVACIRKLIDRNMPVREIADLNDLTLEEVNAIIRQENIE